MQVIVKLANILLTPDKPEYNGGSWHIEVRKQDWLAAYNPLTIKRVSSTNIYVPARCIIMMRRTSRHRISPSEKALTVISCGIKQTKIANGASAQYTVSKIIGVSNMTTVLDVKLVTALRVLLTRNR